jgi:hypothetical protein
MNMGGSKGRELLQSGDGLSITRRQKTSAFGGGQGLGPAEGAEEAAQGLVEGVGDVLGMGQVAPLQVRVVEVGPLKLGAMETGESQDGKWPLSRL